jgi:hypothetical protein
MLSSKSLSKTIRSLELRNITLPVRVEHANLAPEDRIDALPTRIDTLRTKVRLEYDGYGPIREGSMQGCWNYGEVYELLCLQDVRTITGPLEVILDEVLGKTADSAQRQGIVPTFMMVSVDRVGLAVGCPQLSARRGVEDVTAASLAGRGGALYDTRCVGIEDFPLAVSVNHSWCTGSERVEHVDVRRETVSVSFRATSVARELGAADLRGLFNYAGLIRQMQELQGMVVTGPTEQICDAVATLLEDEATQLGVGLLRTDVEVTRSSYEQFTPVIGLTRIYPPPNATSN